jgi:hypothetical protein
MREAVLAVIRDRSAPICDLRWSRRSIAQLWLTFAPNPENVDRERAPIPQHPDRREFVHASAADARVITAAELPASTGALVSPFSIYVTTRSYLLEAQATNSLQSSPA